jgi:hypothetical protein
MATWGGGMKGERDFFEKFPRKAGKKRDFKYLREVKRGKQGL